MRVAIVQPYLPELDVTTNPGEISGANVALDLSLRTYANDPRIEALELYLNPRDISRTMAAQELAARILLPENRGRGRLEMHPIYAIPDIWADGRERILHCDDLHLGARDRQLRDLYAPGPTPIAGDTHCMGHRSIIRSLGWLAGVPTVPYDRIYAAGTAVADSIRETLAWLKTPHLVDVRSIARLIDLDGLRPRPSASEQGVNRASLGLPLDGAIALVFGRITPSTKGDLLALITMFAEASTTGEHLVIVGNEEMVGYAKAMRSLAEECGVASRVHMRPGVKGPQKGDLYRASDFVIFPADSGNEVFGLVAVEAMACGIPVLGTDWDGLKDTIVDGETGYRIPTYVPPALGRFDELSFASDEQTSLLLRAQATVIDRRKMMQAMRRLFSDAEMRQKMGEAAHRRFQDVLHPDRLFTERLEGYREQLAMARSEPVIAAKARRQASLERSQRVPLEEQFRTYGTGRLDDPNLHFRTSPRGHAVLAGERALPIMAEVSAVIPPAAAQALLSAASHLVSASELIDSAERAGLPTDIAWLTLGILCKSGHISIGE